MGFNEKGEIIRKSGSQRQTKKNKSPRPAAVYAAAGAVGMLLVIGVLQWLLSSLPQPDEDKEAANPAPAKEATPPRSASELAVDEVFRDALKDGGQGPEMVVLPAGSFWMGDLSGDGGSDEGPVRTVTIGRRLAMGRYEVTFAEYDRFADADSRSRPADQGWGRGSRPVINVSQEDAQAYAAWLSTQTGQRYRLPSEAEWEYAARAGTRTRYSWGDSISCSQARYGRRPSGECSNSLDGTVPVGSFAANAFGLFDMHGNVWEWVEDCLHYNYEGAPTDGGAWTTGCDDGYAVVRGGSWADDPRGLRSAFRFAGLTPSYRSFFLGFRLVQDLNP